MWIYYVCGYAVVVVVVSVWSTSLIRYHDGIGAFLCFRNCVREGDYWRIGAKRF